VVAIVALFTSFFKAWNDQVEIAIRAGTEKAELEWPADRPKLSFVAWGLVTPDHLPPDYSPAMASQTGFYLSNDGSVALDVRVHDFLVGGTRAKSKNVRIEAKSVGFAMVWLECPSPIFKWRLDQQLAQTAIDSANNHTIPYGGEFRVHLRVTYRDFGNLGYASEADLVFHRHLGRIEFSSPIQTKLGLQRPGGCVD
jgi:hypothetical protein